MLQGTRRIGKGDSKQMILQNNFIEKFLYHTEFLVCYITGYKCILFYFYSILFPVAGPLCV